MNSKRTYFNVIHIEKGKEYVLNGKEFNNISDAIEYASHYSSNTNLKIKRTTVEEEIIDLY